MAFLNANFSKMSTSGNNLAMAQFGYSSAVDAQAAVQASAYFNEQAGRVHKDDLILARGTDGVKLLEITSATGIKPVTTAIVTL